MIYLDHNATCPLLPEAVDAMRPWWGAPANAASAHAAGQKARMALENAREQVARLIGRDPAGLVFTSGATEANQAWFYGVVEAGARHLAVGAVEHPCVAGAAARARRAGVRVDVLPVGPDGRVDPSRMDPGVEAASLMAANHETGVIQPFAAVPIACHVDAAQAAGRVALPFGSAHAVTLSAHKLGGPSGIGALSLRDGEAFPALLCGGSAERGRRAGTVNVAGAVGFGAAASVALRELSARSRVWSALQQRLEGGLRALGGEVVGAHVERLPQTTLVTFAGVPGELIVQALDHAGIAVSAGAACASGSTEPSPVLTAMGHPHPTGGVRFSLGPTTVEADIDAALAALAERLPALSALADL